MKKVSVLLALVVTAALYAQDKPAEKGDESGKRVMSRNLPNGYGSLTWGVPLSKARENITGKMVYTDEKTIIISKDGELKYFYGFFYRDPAKLKIEAVAGDMEKGADDETKQIDEGTLFYVSLKFPYLVLDDVLKKMTDKYGKPTNDNLVNNRGAIAWDGEKTVIMMWIDDYEKKPYCRRITYVNKGAIKEINNYHHEIFNKTEMSLLKKLNP